MTSEQLTHADIGCWVLKADPGTWDYFSALRDSDVRPGEVIVSDWTVGTNYRSRLMRRHDPMVLWVTGNHRPGIYEVGRLTDGAKPSRGMNPDYLVDESRGDEVNNAVGYWSVRLREPVPRSELQEHQVLSGAEHFRSPRLTNPTYLTKQQWRSLRALLEGRISEGALHLVREWPTVRADAPSDET